MPAGIARRGGKKNRKHGRNSRRASSKRQPERTAANKLARVLREALKAHRHGNHYRAPGYLITDKGGMLHVQRGAA